MFKLVKVDIAEEAVSFEFARGGRYVTTLDSESLTRISFKQLKAGR